MVESNGLENRRTARYRGFESHPLRHILSGGNIKKKLAIVLSGGGMTCSYSAGFLKSLVDNYGIKYPDIVIAGSGGSGTISYYAADQYDAITSIWSNLLSVKEFLNIKRFWRVVNIDYLIDTVFKIQAPLDTTKLHNSKTLLLIPTIDFQSGQIKYFSNRDRVDFFEILRATNAMPVLYRKRVKINNRLYCDSQLSSSSKANVVKAVEMGATHILNIRTNNPGRTSKLIYKIWLLLRGYNFNKNYSQAETLIDESTPKSSVNILNIRPKNLRIRGLVNDKKLLKETITRGYNDCKESESLKIFLKDYNLG